MINSGDELVFSSVKKIESESYLLEIDTRKFDLNTQCYFNIEKQHIGDNYYQYRFVFNQQILETLIPVYSVDYLNVSFMLGNGDEIMNGFATCDKSFGYKKIKADKGILSFSGDSGYMEIYFILYDTTPDNEINLKINCSIKGNGFNSLNRINGIEHEVII